MIDEWVTFYRKKYREYRENDIGEGTVNRSQCIVNQPEPELPFLLHLDWYWVLVQTERAGVHPRLFRFSPFFGRVFGRTAPNPIIFVSATSVFLCLSGERGYDDLHLQGQSVPAPPDRDRR